MDLKDVVTLIGQGLSLVAVVLGFVSFQMKEPKKMLIYQVATALLFSTHYLLIGAMTAMALNLLSAIKCVSYYFRNKRGKQTLLEPIFFTALVIVTSLLSWDAWYSIFIMVGLVINSISFALPNATLIKKLNLIKSPLCLIYNALAFSVGGVVYEVFTLLSSVISLLANRKKAIKTFDD